MSTFESDLLSHLRGDAAISGVVADRIYPIVLPKSKTDPCPCITYTVIFGQPYNSLDGFTSGLSKYQVQIDCWALNATVARNLARLVRDRLNTPGQSFHTVIDQYPLLEDYEPDTARFRRALGVSCTHEEP